MTLDPRAYTMINMIPDMGVKIVDVGCNNGFLSEKLKKRGNYVVGIEINEELAMQAKERIDSVIVQDVEETWNIASVSFDIVHMGFILEHVFDFHKVLNEANRVLKLGGALLISTPNFGYLLHRVEVLMGKVPSWYRNFDHIRPWTKSWLKVNLLRHGFRPIEWRGSFSIKVPIVSLLGGLSPTLSSILICKSIKFKEVQVQQ